MEIAKAFAPGNISCIFVIENKKLAKNSGSKGVGFTINKGVYVSVKKSNKNIIKFNNNKINFKTIEFVREKLTKEKVEIKIKSELPLGSGFGISGASALATAYAINKLFNLRKNKLSLGKVAHEAEVVNSTGLGDVVNQYFGGIVIKKVSSSKFKVKQIRSNQKIYYKIFSKLDTKKVITSKKDIIRINKAGNKCLRLINNDFDDLIRISKKFSYDSGLLKNRNVKKLIEKLENASRIMLGNAVFSNKYFKGSKRIQIRNKGAYVL